MSKLPAKRRKMATSAQSREARRAKERAMPKKLKPEPKAGEPKKPYEMTSEETDANIVQRVDVREGGTGRRRGCQFGQGGRGLRSKASSIPCA
jgi:hypothetical protein